MKLDLSGRREKRHTKSPSLGLTEAINEPCPVCPNLSFDYLMNGTLLYPSRIKDFMNYLRVVERTEENLKFFLWFRDYERRFSELPPEERAKSPIWLPNGVERKNFIRSRAGTSAGRDNNIEAHDDQQRNSFVLPPISCSHLKPADITFEDSDQSQPFRHEISMIAKMFLYPSSPLELNLSESERVSCLTSLQHTTHPSALCPAARAIETSLRHRSHPSFLYRQISSMNDSRTKFGYFMASTFFIMGPIFAVLLVLSSWSRWYRIIPCILAGHGCWALLMVRRGICPMLLVLKREQTEPWDDPEDFDDDGFLKGLSRKSSISSASSGRQNGADEENTAGGEQTDEMYKYRFDDPAVLNVFLMDREAAERTRMLVEQDNSKAYFRKLMYNGVREVEGAFRRERLLQAGRYMVCYISVAVVMGAIVLPLPRYGIL